MKITIDTNLLVRALIEDDPMQAASASELQERAVLIALPIPVACELVWVLRNGYRKSAQEVESAPAEISRTARSRIKAPAWAAISSLVSSAARWQNSSRSASPRRSPPP